LRVSINWLLDGSEDLLHLHAELEDRDLPLVVHAAVDALDAGADALGDFVVGQLLVVFEDHRGLRAVAEEQRGEAFRRDHQRDGFLVLHDRRGADDAAVDRPVIGVAIADVDHILPGEPALDSGLRAHIEERLAIIGPADRAVAGLDRCDAIEPAAFAPAHARIMIALRHHAVRQRLAPLVGREPRRRSILQQRIEWMIDRRLKPRIGALLELKRDLRDILRIHLNAGRDSRHRQRGRNRDGQPRRAQKPRLDAAQPVVDITILRRRAAKPV
jgi:hypothetical protein